MAQKKQTKLDAMQNYVKQLQSLKVKDFNAAEFGAIVDRLGPANYNLDASLVSASDQTELEGVYTRFVADDLAIKDHETGMKLIKKVLVKMKKERRKYRAVFYYLLKQTAGK